MSRPPEFDEALPPGISEIVTDDAAHLVGPSDVRGSVIRLTTLLVHAREYVADALDAHEHSDGRELLQRIDAALSPLRASSTDPIDLAREASNND